MIVEEDELVEGVPSSEDMATRRSRTGWLPASKIEKENIPAPTIEEDTVPADHSRSRRQHSRQKRRLTEHEVLAHSRACVQLSTRNLPGAAPLISTKPAPDPE